VENNILLTLVLLAPLVALGVVAWRRHVAAERRRRDGLASLARWLGMTIDDDLSLSGTRGALSGMHHVRAGTVSSNSGPKAVMALEVNLTLDDPAPSDERGAAHLHRDDVGSLWKKPSREQGMPNLAFETPLGRNLDDEYTLYTQDGERPPALSGRGLNALLSNTGFRRLDIVPSRYLGEEPGELRVRVHLSQPQTAEAYLRTLRDCDRAFELGLPTREPELATDTVGWTDAIAGALMLGVVGGFILTFVFAILPPFPSLMAQALCPPGESLEWITSSTGSNGTGVSAQCSHSPNQMVFLPTMLFGSHLVFWPSVALLTRSRRRKRGEDAKR